MREIKFRGKNIIGKWVYGDLLRSNNLTYICKKRKNGVEQFNIEDKATLGQYTGLKDKKGAKIYEGDIIQIPNDWEEYGFNAGEIYEVYFAYGGFRLKPKRNKNAKGYWLEDDNLVTVIGNIHDNQVTSK